MVQIRTLVDSKEYSEFKNLVILLENSFAEVKKNGTGIQQVRLAVTPEFLVIASYVSLDENNKTLELVNVIPLDYLRISAYSDRHHIIRVCYCTGNVRYYELSERNNFSSVWRCWCDRIQFLNGEMLSSSVSDLSISKTDRAIRNTGGGTNQKHDQSSYADIPNEDPLKDVLNMLDLSGTNSKDEIGIVVNKPLMDFVTSLSNSGEKCKKFEIKKESKNARCVPRFASGVSEKCENHLTLGVFDARPRERISCKKNSETVLCPKDTVVMSVKECASDMSIYFSPREFIEMVEENVEKEKGETTVRVFFSPRK